jgi:purine-nucleoside phosphorylase
VLQELGIKTLVVSNAAGGLNPGFDPGDIMIIRDHINLTGANPLIGPNEDAWGPRFPDMSAAYDRGLADLAMTAGSESGVQTRSGVYVGLKGPALETPAEVRYLRFAGADAVGFSTVQEVIAAVHANMRVLGLSTITNVHDPDRPAPATVREIIDIAQAVAPELNTIIDRVLTQT